MSKKAKKENCEMQPASEQTVQEVDVSCERQPSSDYTQQEIEQIVDEIVATPKRQRIWEVDFVRGLMILFVVWDHLMWDLENWGPYTNGFFVWLYDFACKYGAGDLRLATHDAFVTMFVFTSGVSCSFSRNNGRRGIKMAVFALLLTAVTYAASSVMQDNITMHFNVIHVIALSVLLWTVIEWAQKKCVKPWQKNIFGFVIVAVILTVLVVGSVANLDGGGWKNQNPMWFFLAMHDSGVAGFSEFWGGDYLPFFPDFGWFLVGAFLGQMLYKEKKTLFPSVDTKWVCPFTFCGRYSIWIYFGSQIVMTGILLLLTQVLNCI